MCPRDFDHLTKYLHLLISQHGYYPLIPLLPSLLSTFTVPNIICRTLSVRSSLVSAVQCIPCFVTIRLPTMLTLIMEKVPSCSKACYWRIDARILCYRLLCQRRVTSLLITSAQFVLTLSAEGDVFTHYKCPVCVSSTDNPHFNFTLSRTDGDVNANILTFDGGGYEGLGGGGKQSTGTSVY